MDSNIRDKEKQTRRMAIRIFEHSGLEQTSPRFNVS